MIVTEDQARRLWCPAVRPTFIGNVDPPEPANCIGSGCMAWRWHEWRMKRGPDGQFLTPAVQEQVGYCGMAYSVRLP
jgi:hypothetical protein